MRVNGPALRAIREALGIPGRTMAKDLGVSGSLVSQAELGLRDLSDEVITDAARYLDVDEAAIRMPLCGHCGRRV